MNIYLFDGTFDGFLTVVFNVFETKKPPTIIINYKSFNTGVWGTIFKIETDLEKAKRVEIGLRKIITKEFYEKLFKVFHSEHLNIELFLLGIMKEIFFSNKFSEDDFRKKEIVKIHKISKQFDKEVHRMFAFVRFQKNKYGIYQATISPTFNVLTFLGDHFKERFTDQKWVIFDEKRKKALHYNLENLILFEYEDLDANADDNENNLALESEEVYISLFKNYLVSVNIPERKNKTLQLHHMPRKYWKHLIEIGPRK